MSEQTPKRIVICCREWGASTGRYARSLVKHLQSIDNVNEYIILLLKKDYDQWIPESPNFTKMLCPYEDYTVGEQVGLKKMIDDLKPDLVHFTMTQQPIFYRGKVVTTMHDLTLLRFNNPSKNMFIYQVQKIIYGMVCRIVAKKSVKIITPTSYVKTDVAAYTKVESAKINTIYEGSSFINDRPKKVGDLSGKKFIMYVGRPNPHKNLERLIEAFKIVRESHPDLHLVLAGAKDSLYERIHARYSGTTPNLYFTDYVSDGELRWLYENCMAYIFPSLSEGFGLPGLEAMSHGAPVVSSNATCLPEVYGDAALYFDPYDIDDMADKIERVVTSLSDRNTLIKRGKKQSELYSWKKMAIETLAIYKSILNK